MAKIKIMRFSNGKFKARGVWQNGEPWLVAKDVCKMFELSDVYQAVSRLGEDEKRGIKSELPKDKGKAHRNSTIWLVNESGFYRFFFSCRKVSEETKEFKKWIGHEVFPAIRRAGAATILRCVYVLLMSNQTVKIGQTQYFERRLRQIELSSGLTVLKQHHTDYFDGQTARRLEKAMHELFADKRILGEFFKVSFQECEAQLAEWSALTK